jgi:alkylation response protein AidB-like acyl-CoA dehydrogenase
VLNGASGIELLPAGEAFAALERAVDIGIAAVCAEAVGAMDRLVALTVEYMNTRKQFGVPIATFQALRHRIADVKMQLELARSMSYFATLKLGEPAPRGGARCRRPRCSSASRCASSASSASSCTAASASPTSTRRATTSSG